MTELGEAVKLRGSINGLQSHSEALFCHLLAGAHDATEIPHGATKTRGNQTHELILKMLNAKSLSFLCPSAPNFPPHQIAPFRWLKIKEMYCLTILKDRNPKSRC